MGIKDQDLLCVLLYLCNGQIYQWKRLKIALYALSEGGRKERKKWKPFFSYKFEDWCYYGPNDHELWRDLIALKFNDYLEFEIDQKPYEMTSHSLYCLEEKGVAKAKSLLQQLDLFEREILEGFAQQLMNAEYDATWFFAEYARKWEEEHLLIVDEVLKEVEKDLPELARIPLWESK